MMGIAALAIAAGAGPTGAQTAQQREHFASRADAKLHGSGASATIVTDGYGTAGDGGGATYRNAGNVGTAQPTDESSFKIGNVLFQYVPDAAGIDVRQFGAKCNWDGTGLDPADMSAADINAQDDRPAIQSAIDFAARKFGEDDRGGGGGQVVKLPARSCMIGSTLRIKDQVTLKGHGPYSSVLVMPQTFAIDTHFVAIGSTTGLPTELASFASRLEDLQLWSNNGNAVSGMAMAYSNNTQHTGGLARVKIFGGNRTAVKFEHGWGGASYVTLEDVEAYNYGDKDPRPTKGALTSVNPVIVVDYGEGTFVRATNILVAGPWDADEVDAQQNPTPYYSESIGLILKGGQVEIDGFHAEGVGYPIWLRYAKGSVRLRNLTGGNGCKRALVTIPNAAGTAQDPHVPQNTAIVGMAQPNGCADGTGTPVALKDHRPGGVEVTGTIIEDRKY
jgi:hypothetical protein